MNRNEITFDVDLGVEPGLLTFDDSNVFFLSDTHFGHKNIIKYSNRPFSDIPEMNLAMQERWHNTVGPDDILIHCGDVCFTSTNEMNSILDSLPGYKVLVKGNHDWDRGKKKFRDLNFDYITDKLHFTHNGIQYIMTHVPVADDQLQAGKLLNIHGHIHNKKLETGLHICACVELIDYTPVTLPKLIEANLKWVNDPDNTHREEERRTI
ncbi:hypothetical protein RsoM2USA_35 [Ralstonia phage RsoM2USA]|nr:hypothetical protein RsoM2USA_35 [Ralstonia phage RsoM2USA]